MTSKEKAIELIDKMNNVDLNCKNESMCMLYPHAIECALIAVDEMLDNNEKCISSYKSNYERICRGDFWGKVKKEILTIKTK